MNQCLYSSMRLTVGVLPEVFLGGEAQFVVPFFAEACRERLFQESVGADAEPSSESFGAFAYLPAVEIDGSESVILLETDGV